MTLHRAPDRAERIYRGLLYLGPRHLRDRHADDMAALFLETLTAARTHGRLAVVRVWALALSDLVRARTARMFRRRDVPHIPGERRPLMFSNDVRYTCRWLARQKLSTALVVGMLAIGIAANVVVFGLVNGLFLRPFPFPEPERLVYINEKAPRWNLEVVGVNYPDFHQWRKEAKLFDAIATYDEFGFNLSDGAGAERIDGASVSDDFAAVLGVQPMLGRWFTAEEDRPKAMRVVVIAEGLWRERFGGSDTALGRGLKLNGVVHTIVGVMPAFVRFPGNVRIWVPRAGDPAQPFQSYGGDAIGRLKRGVATEDAEKDLLRTQQAIWDARDKDRVVSPFVRPLREVLTLDFRNQAATLLSAVAILLVVACANVASVMLARALARRREMGIRLAVGASRMRLARQLFVENIVLALLGGVVGLTLGYWALRMLVSAAGDQIPTWANFGFDVRVGLFAVAITGITTILFGWAPALHAIRGNLKGAMLDAGTGTTAGPGGRRTLSWLVGAEFAMAAVLLVSGGLLFRAYQRVTHVDTGFRSDHVLTFMVDLPNAVYESSGGKKIINFWEQLIDRLQTTPGVQAAGIVSCPPLGCHWGTFYMPEGRAPLKPGEVNPVILYRPASDGYFKAMGIRLLRGRFFDRQDLANRSTVAVVNESFARAYWPGVVDPIGKRFKGNDPKAPWTTVIGLVADIKHYGLERPMRPGIYYPMTVEGYGTMTVAIRTEGEPAQFTSTARAVLQSLDRDLPMYRVRTMEDALKRSMAQRATYSWLLGIFAAMSLLLALGGTYGVTSYLVSQRTREIGIRVALGARRPDIVRTVLAKSLVIVSVGVLVGVAGSIGLSRFMDDLLFGVSPYDPRILAGSAAALFALATLANLLPAGRAARIDPMTSLRGE
jgi:putative ABC transport system permease protein